MVKGNLGSGIYPLGNSVPGNPGFFLDYLLAANSEALVIIFSNFNLFNFYIK